MALEAQGSNPCTHLLLQKNAKAMDVSSIIMGYRQAVRHSTLTAVFAGSNPASPVKAGVFIFLNNVDVQSFHDVVNMGY